MIYDPNPKDKNMKAKKNPTSPSKDKVAKITAEELDRFGYGVQAVCDFFDAELDSVGLLKKEPSKGGPQ